MQRELINRLQKWTTPAVYNGWEAVTRQSRLSCFNKEPIKHFTPEQGVMTGYAVTIVIEPGNHIHPKQNKNAWEEYRTYVASIPEPKIVMVQDLDRPYALGAFWGEVNTTVHKALGCIGTVTDGAVRDLDEIRSADFNVLARQLCIGHAWSYPKQWGCEISVFGCSVKSGQLIHADQHGFLAVPEEDEPFILEATEYLDALEKSTLIPAAKKSRKNTDELIRYLSEADADFNNKYSGKFKSVNKII